jgi:hypothetical protein
MQLEYFRVCFKWGNEQFKPRMLLLSVGNGAINTLRYWQQRNERSLMCSQLRIDACSDVGNSANTTRFSYPYQAMNVVPALGIRILIATSCTYI